MKYYEDSLKKSKSSLIPIIEKKRKELRSEKSSNVSDFKVHQLSRKFIS